MPEIGYWKYVRFTDDEKQYFGTDDDVTIVFDSADDRLEYRTKKDIRFEDDTGNEILTLDKANRHVEIPVQLNVAALEEYVVGAGITVRGTLMFSGADLDLAGNLLKNPKLGTDLKTNGYDIYHGVSNDDKLTLAGGVTTAVANGALIHLYGAAHPTVPGRVHFHTAKINNPEACFIFYTANTVPVVVERLRINQGDDPDIDITNAFLDFHDQALEATAGALQGYVIMKVGGAKFKFPAYALT